MITFKIENKDKGELEDITVKFNETLEMARGCDDEVLIEFEKGEYHFYKDFSEKERYYASNTDSGDYPDKYCAIKLKNQKNITIDGNGSLFLMHGKMVAITCDHSENIAFKNFSWDFPCAGTFEMKVIKKGRFYTDFEIPKEAQFEIEKKKLFWLEKSPFDGKDYWRNCNENMCYCIVGFDEQTKNSCRRNLTVGPLPPLTIRKIEKLTDNTVRVHYFTVAPKGHKVGVSFEICTNKRRDCMGGFIWESKNISFENVSGHYMHGFGFLTQMSENVSFKNFNIIPRKGTGRNNTSFADCLHFSGAKGQVNIENCSFSNPHDDPINIHGTFTRVKERLDDYTLVLEYAHKQQCGFIQYHLGDKVVFYSRSTLLGVENEKEYTVEGVVNPCENGNSVKEMQVKFKEKLPDCFGSEIAKNREYVAENATYSPNVHISGCHFSSVPTRGILCTVRGNVVIENNVFDGMTMASIYLSNDSDEWYESGPIRDMTIRNNEFFVKKANQNEWANKPAIFVDPVVRGKKLTDIPVHKNIIIDSNVFHMEHDNVVFAKSVENLTITNNVIDRIDSKAAEKEIKAFKFFKCKNVKISDNKATSDIDCNPIGL